jgi:hypothetical protein
MISIFTTGLAPNIVGLAQAKLMVPLSTNDCPFALTMNGVASNGSTLAVKSQWLRAKIYVLDGTPVAESAGQF